MAYPVRMFAFLSPPALEAEGRFQQISAKSGQRHAAHHNTNAALCNPSNLL